MYRALLTAAAAAALVIGGAAPAVAAPSAGRPGAPTAVQVTGAGDGATVTWNAPRSGAKVTGWRVAIRPTAGQPGTGTDTLPASSRSERYGWIRAGVSYTFSVRATGAKGPGPVVRVHYTAPSSTAVAQSLYALDSAGSVVRFPTSGGGAPTTVATNGTGYTADDVGNVFLPSSDGRTLRYVPAAGGSARVLATGLHLTKDLRSDVAGNVYWVDSVSGAITKLPIGGGVPVRLLASSGTAWTVGRDGTVSTFTTTSNGGTVRTVSPRGVVTMRTVAAVDGSPIGYFRGLVADGSGTLYVDYQAFGGSGYHGWWSLAARSSTLTQVATRLAYQYSATNDRSLVLGQSAEWCAAIAEQGPPNPCVADHTVTHLVTRGADGTATDVATSGPAARSNGLWLGAADSAGDLFVDAETGLWRIPAGGGTAEQLSTAQYTRLLAI